MLRRAATLLLPPIAGWILLGWALRKAGDALDEACDRFEDAVRQELESWTQ